MSASDRCQCCGMRQSRGSFTCVCNAQTKAPCFTCGRCAAHCTCLHRQQSTGRRITDAPLELAIGWLCLMWFRAEDCLLRLFSALCRSRAGGRP